MNEALVLRQYKNDWIAEKYFFALKLARFFTRLYSAVSEKRANVKTNKFL